MATQDTDNEYSLTDQQVRRFHNQGFLGPLKLCTESEMDDFRQHVEDELQIGVNEDTIISDSNNFSMNKLMNRHWDCAEVCDVAMSSQISHAMSSIYGPDIMLASQKFWPKGPEAGEVPWHQDGAYYPIHPTITVSAWIAIDEVTEENGCIELIPGSHRQNFLQHVETDSENKVFDTEADPEKVDDDKAVSMELEPGEFFLFTEKTLHRSSANQSQYRRMGMVVRGSVPFVYLYPDSDMSSRIKLMEMHGSDYSGLNETISPPSSCDH